MAITALTIVACQKIGTKLEIDANNVVYSSGNINVFPYQSYGAASQKSVETTPPETTPPETTPSKVTSPTGDEIGRTVYWVESGKVWHTTKNCSSLSRSKNILSGSISAAKAVGKERVCKKCS